MLERTEIGKLLDQYDGYLEWLDEFNESHRLKPGLEPSLNGFMEYLRENCIHSEYHSLSK